MALQRLYVAAEGRGAGVGGALLSRALVDIPAPADVYLDVWQENLGAQRLYARHGFEVVAKKVFATKSGIGAGDDFVMVRRADR